MSSLVEFLLARIAEDQAAARAVESAIAASPGCYASIGLDHPELAAGDCPGYLGEYDPARVLAECAAKRRIVRKVTDAAEASANVADLPGQRGAIERAGYSQAAQALYDVLYELAHPYADHPDFRDEWRDVEQPA